jgi:hypothetical protein
MWAQDQGYCIAWWNGTNRTSSRNGNHDRVTAWPSTYSTRPLDPLYAMNSPRERLMRDRLMHSEVSFQSTSWISWKSTFPSVMTGGINIGSRLYQWNYTWRGSHGKHINVTWVAWTSSTVLTEPRCRVAKQRETLGPGIGLLAKIFGRK